MQQEVERVAAITKQQKAAEHKAADESLKADEREAWSIASTVDWCDLFQANEGCEIPETEWRAVSLDQLSILMAHIIRRLDGGEWFVWRPGDPQHRIMSINEVVSTSSRILCTILCCCVRSTSTMWLNM